MKTQHLGYSGEQYWTVPAVEVVNEVSRDEVGLKRLFRGLGHVAQGVAEGLGPLFEPFTHSTPAQVESYRKP